MSDNDKKTSFIDKATKAAAVGAGIAAAGVVLAAVIPQDELAKKGLPALWESIKGIAALNWLRLEEAAKKFRPVAFAWGAKLWSAIIWWTLLSIALICAGIEVKTRLGSNFGHILVAAGTISCSALGLLLFTLSDGIAAIAYVGLKTCGSIFGKAASIVGVNLPEVIDEAGLTKFRGKVRLVLAGTLVMNFSLLFTMFFPAWSTLGWTLIFWAMVSVALIAAIYLDMQMGKAVKVVFYATIALIVGTFVVFLLDRLTGGAISFGGFQKRLNRVNGSELLVAILVLVPVTLLFMGVFAKDKDKKASFGLAAKYVGIGAGVLAAFLLWKGTISWKQLAGKEPPKVLTRTVDKAEGAYLNALEGRPSVTTSSPQGTTSNGGRYMAPPSSSEPPRAKTQRRAAKPLPKEEPKNYSNLTQGMDDLEALGY